MIYVDNHKMTDARLNLALEEHLLRHVPTEEPMVLFYVNQPAVIVGRNQNTLEEIDPDYVAAQGIQVVRRLSGGGAVYHDLGNLNFSFITNGSRDLHNFQRFTAPVIRVLNQLNVPAVLQGKSNIYVEGKKISGNAQYLAGNRMVSHGTILVDSDLEALLRALNPRQVEIESKAVQSIRAVVGNVADWLPEMDVDSLRQALLAGLSADGPVEEMALTAVDWDAVHQIKAERYDTWEWNIGRSPFFVVQKRINWAGTEIGAEVAVKNGRIQSLSFTGPLAGCGLQTHLIGHRYDPVALAVTLDAYGPVHDLPAAQLLKLLY